MKKYTQEQIDKALAEIANLDHYDMCRMWRFGADEIYFRSDLPTGPAFRDRLFKYFGGFTPAISKELGWEKADT